MQPSMSYDFFGLLGTVIKWTLSGTTCQNPCSGFILTCVESRVCAYALFIFWDQVIIEEGNFFVLFDDNLFKYMLK